MTASVQEQIQARIAAALLGATDAGASVSRSQETFLARETPLAIGIFPGPERDSVFSAVMDEHDLVVIVDVFGRGDPWCSVADVVVVQAHRLLLADAPLRALVTHIRRSSRDPIDEEPDKTAGVYRLEYQIRYLTRSSDVSDSTIL